MKLAAIYASTATDSHTTDHQLRELRKAARRQGWKVVRKYIDKGVSCARGYAGRPEFEAMCRDATGKDFDVIMAWSLDHLGRSLQHLISFLDEMHSKRIDLYLHQQDINTTTPSGKAIFQRGGFAEFERARMQDRVKIERTGAEARRTARGRAKVVS